MELLYCLSRYPRYMDADSPSFPAAPSLAAGLMVSIRAMGQIRAPARLFLRESGNHELHHLAATRDWPVNCVRQFQAQLVRAGRQSHEDHRFSAGIDRGPGLVIHVIVQMAHAWRHFQRSFAEHRYNAQVFRAVLNEYTAQGKLFGDRWIDNQFRGSLILDRDQRRRPFDVLSGLCRSNERVNRNRNDDRGGPHCPLGALLLSVGLNHGVLLLTNLVKCQSCVVLIIRRYARSVPCSNAAWVWAALFSLPGSRAPIQSWMSCMTMPLSRSLR